MIIFQGKCYVLECLVITGEENDNPAGIAATSFLEFRGAAKTAVLNIEIFALAHYKCWQPPRGEQFRCRYVKGVRFQENAIRLTDRFGQLIGMIFHLLALVLKSLGKCMQKLIGVGCETGGRIVSAGEESPSTSGNN